MRRPFALFAWLLLASFPPAPPIAPLDFAPGIATMTATPLPLDPGNPRRTRIGGLDYLGGWILTADDKRFGGLSALHIDGEAATALSDSGTIIDFRAPPAATSAITIRTLSGFPGKSGTKTDRDSESLAMAGGEAWIGFERFNAIWRYDRRNWHAETDARPPAMRRWRTNSGAEAMVRLRDGRFLVFGEGQLADGTRPILLFAGDPAVPGTPAAALSYRGPVGFRITDAAMLPDGDIITLNRQVTLLGGIKTAVARISRPALKAGAILRAQEIARLERPRIADNFEGISVTREGKRTILWLVSDDNFNALQQTLLLKFALVESPGQQKGQRP